jgi:hypothetical protein
MPHFVWRSGAQWTLNYKGKSQHRLEVRDGRRNLEGTCYRSRTDDGHNWPIMPIMMPACV